jgi:YD repeat-containing protein
MPSGGSPITPMESYVYDPAGNLTGHTDRRGNTTDYTYDIYNWVIRRQDPAIGANSHGEINLTYNDPINLFAVVGTVRRSLVKRLGVPRRITYE